MRLTRFLTAGVLTALAATLAIPALSAGASVRASSKPTIIIGSTNFEEQAIVSNIWADVLQKAGYTVKVEPALGTRAIVVPAIEKGQIDLEPDYAASLLGWAELGQKPWIVLSILMLADAGLVLEPNFYRFADRCAEQKFF